ncbi:MAG: hypothetical protein ACYS9X_06905 [Planctomycetota bacterium]
MGCRSTQHVAESAADPIALLQEEWWPNHRDVTSRRLRKCPFGHKRLKDVPVLYGLIAWTPELRKAEQNLELWPGGCCVLPERNKVVCAECRYAYSTVQECWEKHGTSASEFLLRQPDFISEWPHLGFADLYNGVVFLQGANRGRAVSDMVHYWSSLPLARIDAKVQEYLSNGPISFRRSTDTYESRVPLPTGTEHRSDRRYVYYTGNAGHHYYLVELMHESHDNKTYICATRSTAKPYGYEQAVAKLPDGS